MLFTGQCEQNTAFCIIGRHAAGAVRAHIMNDARSGHHSSRAALLNPFDMTDFAACRFPQAAYVLSAFDNWFGTFR